MGFLIATAEPAETLPLSFCKDPCLKTHFNCAKVVSGPLMPPPPRKLVPWPHPPSRLRSAAGCWVVCQPRELSAGDIRCYGDRSQPRKRRGLRREQKGCGVWNFPGARARPGVREPSDPRPDSKGGSLGEGIPEKESSGQVAPLKPPRPPTLKLFPQWRKSISVHGALPKRNTF